MLSVEGPSCSCQVSALHSDDRSLDKEARETSCVAQELSPQFSIRDYVSSTRREDVGTNWPFPQQYLQLCLKHGISTLLPPFEPPDCVRSHCYYGKKGSEQLLALVGSGRSAVEQDSPSQKEPTCSSDDKAKSLEHDNYLTADSLLLESAVEGDKQIVGKGNQQVVCGGPCKDADGVKDGEADIESLVTSHLNQFPQPHNEKVLKASVTLEVSRPSSLSGGKVGSAREPSGKKYRLIVKLGTNPELGRADEVSSNSSMISDSMASKVCPVCKTFSSTSNTTLNAHIDQCLSMESNTNQVISTPVKYKVKPTKKRLMVDIYSSAPRCTLEDLDRRNGTNWALDLGLRESRREICTENKRQKVSPVDQADGEMEKGAVYIDSNGNKICILSKLNAMTSSSLGESSKPKPKRFGKGIKQQMRLKMKRSYLAPKQPRNMKPMAARKKVGLLGLLNDQIPERPDSKLVPHAIDNEPQIQPEITSSQYHIRSKVPRALRQLFSSPKGSALSKKLNGSRGLNNCEKPCTMQRQLIESSCSQPLKPSTMKCPTPRIKTVDMLSNATSAGDCKEQSQCTVDNISSHLTGAFSSEGSLTAKPPKSLRRLISFPRRKKLKKDSHLNEKCGNFSGLQIVTSQSFHYSPVEESGHSKFDKSKEISSLPSSVVDKHCRKKHKLIVKRLTKHRSGERKSKEVEELSPDCNECLDINNYGAMSKNGEDDAQVLQITRTDDIINHHLSEQSTVHESEHKVVGGSSEEDGICQSPERLNSEGENHSHEAVDIEMQVEHSTDSAMLTKSAFDGITNSRISAEHLASDGLLATSDSSLKSWARLVENDSFVPGREVWADTHDQRLFDDQMIRCGDETANGVIVSGDVIVGNAELQATGKASPRSPYMECQTNAQQVMGLSTCHSSSGNTGAEIPRGNSSVTSVRITSHDDHGKAIDSEPCESPVSGTSHVSHPSREDLKEQMLEPIIAEGPISDENAGRSDFVDVLESGSLTKKSFAGECNQGVLRTKVAWQDPNIWETQRCCCSRREYVCHEAESLGQYVVPEPKARQASNARPSDETIVSTFDCPILATGKASEVLQSPSDHAFRTVHPDAAVRCMPMGHAALSGQIEQHSAPSPVLRLMGKDVLVVNKDEQSQCQNLIHPSSGRHSSYPRPVTGSALHIGNGDSCPYHKSEGWKLAHCVPMHPSAIQDCSNYGGMPLFGSLGNGNPSHTQHDRLGCYAQFACNAKKSMHPHRHPKPEVIVIEDSEEAEPDIDQPSPSEYNILNCYRPELQAGKAIILRPFSASFSWQGVSCWDMAWITEYSVCSCWDTLLKVEMVIFQAPSVPLPFPTGHSPLPRPHAILLPKLAMLSAIVIMANHRTIQEKILAMEDAALWRQSDQEPKPMGIPDCDLLIEVQLQLIPQKNVTLT